MANGHEPPREVTHEELVAAVRNVLQNLSDQGRRGFVSAYQIFTFLDTDLRMRLLAEGPFGGVGHGEERSATQRITHAAINLQPDVQIEYLETCHLKFYDIPNAPPNQIEVFPAGDECGLYRLK